MSDQANPDRFNDGLIRRRGLPKDVMDLIHDLAYDHDGRDRTSYKMRAQGILRRQDADDRPSSS